MMRLMLSRFDALPSPLPAPVDRRSHAQHGQQLAYVYFESEPGRRSAKLLTKD